MKIVRSTWCDAIGFFENLRRDLDDETVIRESWFQNDYRLEEGQLTGGWVVDVGANIGAFSVLCSQLHWEQRVLAVEPRRDNYALLHKNRMNNDMRGLVLDYAVGPEMSKKGVMKGEGGAAYWCPAQDPGSDELVSTVTLDHLLTHYIFGSDVDLLKVDTEGAEYGILMASKLLHCCRRIVVEFHGPGMIGDRYEPGSLGALVGRLSETHHVETLGKESMGGFIYANQYGG